MDYDEDQEAEMCQQNIGDFTINDADKLQFKLNPLSDKIWLALEQKRQINVALKSKGHDSRMKNQRCANYDMYKKIVEKFETKQRKIQKKRDRIQEIKKRREKEEQLQYRMY